MSECNCSEIEEEKVRRLKKLIKERIEEAHYESGCEGFSTEGGLEEALDLINTIF